MLVAHIPAGYIVTKWFLGMHAEQLAGRERKYLILGLFFSVVPDLDLLYFYFVDSTVHHHKFFPHLPGFWVATLSILIAFGVIFKVRKLQLVVLLITINVLAHLILDTFVGSIWWLYPWVDKPFYMIEIPARFNHWTISFILHWTFLVEVAICLAAMLLFLSSERRAASDQAHWQR